MLLTAAPGGKNYAAVGKAGCSEPCAGNASGICGNANLLSLYNLTTYKPPSTIAQVGYYLSKGAITRCGIGVCWTGRRTNMTVEECVLFCLAENPTMMFAGVEYALECYRADSLPGSATMAERGRL